MHVKSNQIIVIILSLFSLISLAYFTIKFWGSPTIFVPSSAFDVIPNIVKGAGYFGNLPGYDFNFYTHRLPFQVLIPSLLISIVPNNLGLVFFLKNLILLPIFFYSIYRVLNKNNRISKLSVITLAVILLNPFFIINVSSIGTEESYSIIIFSIIFSYFFFKEERLNFYFISLFALLMFLLALLKSSYIFVVLLLPILLWKRYNNKYLLGFGFTGALIAFLLWGYWNYSTTSEFSLSSSYNWFNFYKGNNELTDYYYFGDLDKLPNQFISGDFNNEIEWAVAYKEKSLSFIASEPIIFLKLLLKKFISFFINVVPVTASGNLMKSIIFGISLIAMRLLFYFNFLRFFSQIKDKQIGKEVAFISTSLILFIALYSIPYLIGFAYIRHFLPLTILSFFISVKLDYYQETK